MYSLSIGCIFTLMLFKLRAYIPFCSLFDVYFDIRNVWVLSQNIFLDPVCFIFLNNLSPLLHYSEIKCFKCCHATGGYLPESVLFLKRKMCYGYLDKNSYLTDILQFALRSRYEIFDPTLIKLCMAVKKKFDKLI